MRASLGRVALELLVGAAVGAAVYLAFTVVLYGQGLVSHYAFSPAGAFGAIVGGITGLARSVSRHGAVGSAGASAATSVTLVILLNGYMVLFGGSIPDEAYVRFVAFSVVSNVVPGLIAGAIQARASAWAMEYVLRSAGWRKSP